MKNRRILNLLILSAIILIGFIYYFINMNKSIVKEEKILKEMSDSTQITELNDKINKLNNEHTEYINYIQTCKSNLATILTEEGVATSEQDTLETMATNITKILQAKTKDATATADNITEGKTAYVNGELIVGNGTDNKTNYDNGYDEGNSSSAFYTTKYYYSSGMTYSCSFNIASECPNYANAKHVIVQHIGGNIFVRGKTNSGIGSCGLNTSFNSSNGNITVSCQETVCFWSGQTYTFAIALIF